VSSSWALTRGRERIERLCASGLDVDALRCEALVEIDRVVGFDAHTWPLTDPASGTAFGAIRVIPCASEETTMVKLWYLEGMRRPTAPAGPPRSVRLLAGHTAGRDLSRNVYWSGILGRYGVADMASMAFTDTFGSWGLLDLWREGGRRFAESDADYLHSITAPVTAALRRSRARAFDAPHAPPVCPDGPAILIFNDDLRIIAQAAAGPVDGLLAPGAWACRSAAFNTAAHLLAAGHARADRTPGPSARPEEAPSRAVLPSVRVRVSGGAWATVSAARLDNDVVGGGIVVNVRESSPAELLDLFARVFALTPRERQLLALLANGLDTRELALQMSVSQHTVQDHCKAVFAKASVRSRRELLSKALGSHDYQAQPVTVGRP
jgi:DNA-binding CsgD family transcriptional regulator